LTCKINVIFTNNF